MTPITDYHHYRTEMSKGMEDKLFFLDKIQFDNLLDYGCADGQLIEYLSSEFGSIPCYLGYDQDPKMIALANDKVIPQSFFFDDIDLMDPILDQIGGDTAVLCSSLIHEVYSYGDKDSVQEFWNRLFSGKFKYIVIRDLVILEKTRRLNTSLKDLSLLRDKADKELITSFENIWGPIENRANFLHFLLKYRYTANWGREVQENYFPLAVEDYEQIIPEGFKVIFKEHYLLPFVQSQVHHDFGITLADKTHLKMIIERV